MLNAHLIDDLLADLPDGELMEELETETLAASVVNGVALALFVLVMLAMLLSRLLTRPYQCPPPPQA